MSDINQELLKYRMHIGLVSVDPNIVYVPSTAFCDVNSDVSPLEIIASIFEDGCLFIVQPWWSMLHGTWVQRWVPYVERLMQKSPQSRIVVFCNEKAETDVASSHGFSSLFMPQNAMANENIFRPRKCAKEFDAIYNAKLTSWKRHELACDVSSLALMYSRFGDGGVPYFEKLKGSLPNAIFLNGSLTVQDYRTFNQEEVAHHLSRAKVGLCLSAVEGGMWASIEYLLCGLPVVSTKSLGGRDVFFDDSYCKIVDADPKSVGQAVAEFNRYSLDPDLIHESTLKKIHLYRKTFIDFVTCEQVNYGREATANADLLKLLLDWGGMKHRSIQELDKDYRVRRATTNLERCSAANP